MIYFVCPVWNEPAGGIRRLYHHVDLLNDAGLPAAIVHADPGFRCTWFHHDTQIVGSGNLRLSSDDILVYPEVYGSQIVSGHWDIPRVIYNLNPFLMFSDIPTPEDPAAVYRDERVLGVVVVSDAGKAMQTYVFPHLSTFQVPHSIDRDVWYPATAVSSRLQISYMPRKRPLEANELVQILRVRGVLEGWRLHPIETAEEWEVALALRSSSLFLSLSWREGFGRPPLEALACGCHVIGFDGIGGEEYFQEPYAHRVREGDLLSFASLVERFCSDYARPGRYAYWHDHGVSGARVVCDKYSQRREQTALVDAFSHFLSTRRGTSSRCYSVPVTEFRLDRVGDGRSLPRRVRERLRPSQQRVRPKAPKQ